MKHEESEPAGLPDRPPAVAAEIFGNRLPLAEHFAHLLADTGVTHGLIGPRETPRLWERHLLNCGIVESVLPHRTRLLDIGSGAGLPGLVLAIARPDLDVVLVEPMLRRTTWLERATADLGLINVQVARGKAQDFWGKLRAPVVTARAVARLGELSGWCLPLLEGEGRLLALKGQTAARELAEDEPAVRRAGGIAGRLILVGEEILPEPTRLVEVRIGTHPVHPTESATRRTSKGQRQSGRASERGRRRSGQATAGTTPQGASRGRGQARATRSEPRSTRRGSQDRPTHGS